MVSANFNTEIVSSNSNNKKMKYLLDDVISKDFAGPYNYNFNTEVPDGISIEPNVEGDVLVIFPNIEFELSIVVGNRNESVAIATTIITIEGRPNFKNEIVKFFESENYTQKNENTIQVWAEIISKRISNGDLIRSR
jgi:hypothetical protein